MAENTVPCFYVETTNAQDICWLNVIEIFTMHGTRCIKIVYEICSQTSPPR